MLSNIKRKSNLPTIVESMAKPKLHKILSLIRNIESIFFKK